MGNTGGTMAFDPTTQTLTMTSTITTEIFDNRKFTGNFGTVTMTTGPLLSGSVFSGTALFDGGTYTITLGGNAGFVGSFDYAARWRQIKHSNQFVFVGLGPAFGSNGFEYLNTRMFQFVTLVDGTDQFNVDSGITSVPEPGTVTLMGIGLLAGWLGWTGSRQTRSAQQ